MATRVWLGAALDRPHIVTTAISGGDAGWAKDDTASLTINGKTLTLTVGTASTTKQILADLVDMVNGAAANDDEVRNTTGDKVGEWAEITADGDVSDSLRLTGRSDGRNFTLTVAEVTTGAGTMGAPATSQTGNGAAFWDETTNWSADTLPIDNDTVVFDHRAARSGPKYNIDQNAVTPAKILVLEGFKHTIGLPEVNVDRESLPFEEFLDTYMKMGNVGDVAVVPQVDMTIDSSVATRTKIDNGTAKAIVNVANTGTRASADEPALSWKATNANSTVTVTKGDVGIAFREEELATVITLRVGVDTNAVDTSVVCGTGVTMTTANLKGGSLQTGGAFTTLNMDGGIFTHLDGAITTIICDGGTVIYRADSTLTTLILGSGAILDARQDTRTRTITNAEAHKGSSIRDPHGTVTWTNGIDFYRCQPFELEIFEISAHQTWTNSSI